MIPKACLNRTKGLITTLFKSAIVLLAYETAGMSARADIVYMSGNSTNSNFYITFSGTSITVTSAAPQYACLKFNSTGIYAFNGNTYQPTSSKVAYGSMIDSDSIFTTSKVLPNQTSAADHVYYGIRADAGSGHYYYGWIQVSEPKPATTVTINGVAFESTPDRAIAAGSIASVPEPGTLVLFSMAGGAAAIAALRKRWASRKSITAPATIEPSFAVS